MTAARLLFQRLLRWWRMARMTLRLREIDTLIELLDQQIWDDQNTLATVWFERRLLFNQLQQHHRQLAQAASHHSLERAL